MNAETVRIGDVALPIALLNVRRAISQRSGNRWRLTTRGGVVLAEFASPEAMKAWWELFLKYPRPAKKATTKRPTSKASKRAQSQRPYGSQTPIKDDPQMPWNSDYDMPEFDAS